MGEIHQDISYLSIYTRSISECVRIWVYAINLLSSFESNRIGRNGFMYVRFLTNTYTHIHTMTQCTVHASHPHKHKKHKKCVWYRKHVTKSIYKLRLLNLLYSNQFIIAFNSKKRQHNRGINQQQSINCTNEWKTAPTLHDWSHPTCVLDGNDVHFAWEFRVKLKNCTQSRTQNKFTPSFWPFTVEIGLAILFGTTNVTSSYFRRFGKYRCDCHPNVIWILFDISESKVSFWLSGCDSGKGITKCSIKNCMN